MMLGCVLVLTLLISACSQERVGRSSLSQIPPHEAKLEKVSYGSSEAVATAHPLATATARKILEDGGNAIDAAIAASLMLAVVRPQSTGIGGGGFLLFFDANRSTVRAYDFREWAPQKISADFYKLPKVRSQRCALDKPSVNGPHAVGVPGLIPGLVATHQAHGSLPWEMLVQPALEVARNGFTVYPALARAIEYRQAVLTCFESSRELFLPKGKPLEPGSVLVQENLARTLETLSKDPLDNWQKGRVGRDLIRALENEGSVMSAKDLEEYQVRQRQPLVFSFRNILIASFPPPSSGGVHLGQMLYMASMLTEKRNDVESNWFDEPILRHHWLAHIMRSAFSDRAHYLGDPHTATITPQELLATEYLDNKIRRLANTPPEEQRYDLPSESPETTHLSIIDRFGNAVSSTQTINTYFGSGMIAGDTGIVFNNEMDDFWTGGPNAFGLAGSQNNAPGPGKPPLSSMTPTLVLDPSVSPRTAVRLVIGSPGGPRIISATFLSLFNVLIRGLSLPEAVSEQRLHHQWNPDILYAESPSHALSRALERLGHHVEKSNFFGDVQAIGRMENQQLVAVSDQRSEGLSWAR